MFGSWVCYNHWIEVDPTAGGASSADTCGAAANRDRGKWTVKTCGADAKRAEWYEIEIFEPQSEAGEPCWKSTNDEYDFRRDAEEIADRLRKEPPAKRMDCAGDPAWQDDGVRHA
jgi:hypothetical protein